MEINNGKYYTVTC